MEIPSHTVLVVCTCTEYTPSRNKARQRVQSPAQPRGNWNRKILEGIHTYSLI